MWAQIQSNRERVSLTNLQTWPYGLFMWICALRDSLGSLARQKKRGPRPPQIARCGQRPLVSQTVMNDDRQFKPQDQSTSICTNINSLF